MEVVELEDVAVADDDLAVEGVLVGVAEGVEHPRR